MPTMMVDRKMVADTQSDATTVEVEDVPVRSSKLLVVMVDWIHRPMKLGSVSVVASMLDQWHPHRL
jgi:hypothetical protein